MGRKTNKTAHVLRLLATNEFDKKENPILNDEFKEEVILHKNNITISNEADEIAIPKTAGINIISELIEENLDSVLDRFRCCSCEKCKEEIMISALNFIEPKYVSNKMIAAEEIEEMKLKYKSSVVSVLVKYAIQLKNNPIHEETPLCAI